jgi:hypothetical protein
MRWLVVLGSTLNLVSARRLWRRAGKRQGFGFVWGSGLAVGDFAILVEA